MKTDCTPCQIEFQGLGRREVQGAFDGGHIGSDGGALLLRETDIRLGITEALTDCFTDHRAAERIEHRVWSCFGSAFAALRWAMKTSMITLNRLGLTPAEADGQSRCKKVVCHPERLGVLSKNNHPRQMGCYSDNCALCFVQTEAKASSPANVVGDAG